MINFANTALAHTLEGGETDLFAAHHGFGMMGGFGWGWVFFGWIFMILFWALVILAVIALAKYIRGGSNNDETIRRRMSDSLKKVYVCPECGYEYDEKEWAIKCQKWCAEHKSCNMEIIKHGRPPQK